MVAVSKRLRNCSSRCSGGKICLRVDWAMSRCCGAANKTMDQDPSEARGISAEHRYGRYRRYVG